MSATLPYKVEISVGSQNCTRCKKIIKLGTIQLGVMIQVSNLKNSDLLINMLCINYIRKCHFILSVLQVEIS